MTRRSQKPLNKKLRSLYSWHRWLGVISAVFIIWLSITGIVLEHSHSLDLGKRSISNKWLLGHFDIEVTAPTTALKYESHWLTQVDGRLYLNTQMIDQGPAPVAFCRLGLLWAVASRETLWLLNDRGEVLEKLAGLDLPGRILAMSKTESGLLVQTARGNFIADPLSTDWPDWKSSTKQPAVQYAVTPLPDSMRAQLVTHAEGYTLNWERILLEAHSGRAFGPYGVWLMDAMAVIFIVLGVTGLSLWLRYRRAARNRKAKLRTN